MTRDNREANAWSKLRESLILESRERGRASHICRVENLLASGMFDANICFSSQELWLEGKAMEYLPVRKSTKVKVGFSEDQDAWAVRGLLSGRRLACWLHVQCDRSGAGRGWYFFSLQSLDHIAQLRLGMDRSYVDSCFCLDRRQLASRILDYMAKDGL